MSKPVTISFESLTASWREEANCLALTEVDPTYATAWDFEYGPQMIDALSTCADCPVRKMCLEDAVKDSDAIGYRAGYFFRRGWVSEADAREIKQEYPGVRGIRTKPRNDVANDLEV